MISIPIEIGDTILAGRFKNKKITVREISYDEYGSPTVNGRSILKIRIPKLYQMQENSMKLKEEVIPVLYKVEFNPQLKQDPIFVRMTDQQRNAAKNYKPVKQIGGYGDGFGKGAKIPGNEKNIKELDYKSFLKLVKSLKESLIKETSDRLSKQTSVKIKKSDGRWHIYADTIDGEECISPQGYETKEQAEHAAMMKGYSFKGNPYNSEFKGSEPLKPTKSEPIKHEKPKEIDLGKEKELKLENLIREVIRKELNKKKVIKENSELDAEIEEYARLSDQIDKMKSELAKLESRFKELDEKFRVLLEALSKELDVTDKTYIRAKNILITIKRKGYDRTNVSYKDAFEFIHKKVSPQLRKMMDEVLKTSKTVTYIKSQLGVQYESSGWIGKLFTKVKTFFINSIKTLRNLNKSVNTDLNQIEKMI